MPVFSLIPAAGSGSRFAGGQPKQYARIAGRTMLWHAVRAVCVPPVETVFVVLAEGDQSFAAQDWSAFDGKVQPLHPEAGEYYQPRFSPDGKHLAFATATAHGIEIWVQDLDRGTASPKVPLGYCGYSSMTCVRASRC